jgi:hypothetical protein
MKSLPFSKILAVPFKFAQVYRNGLSGGRIEYPPVSIYELVEPVANYLYAF